jgi:autoinducer 2 (AI-2) kinase
MFDLTSRSWSTDTVSLCHLPDSALPEVADTGTPIGVVMDGAAQDMGLARGTPVVLGGWDTALAQIGAGLPNSDQLTVIGGTFWKASALTNDPVIDPRGQLRSVCHAVPALWMLEAIGFYSGLTLRWFRDGFCQEEKRQAEASGMDTYALMEQQALDVPPGSGGVIGVFSNVMNVQAWRHAAPSFVQFDIGHPETSGKRECIRAIEESAAYVVRAHLTLLENALGRDLREIFLGGGAAKARLWPRVLADITGRCVRVATSGETTTRGAAIVAAIGVDLLDDLPATSRRLARVREVIEPDPSRLQTYEALYEQWISVNRGMLQLTDRAGLAPLWRAPGSPDAAPGIVTSTAASRDDEP